MRTAEVAPESLEVEERRTTKLQSAKRIALRVLIDAMAVMVALFSASIIRFEIMGESPALQNG